MRFICPYCKAETTSLSGNRPFSEDKCKSCGKKYLIMPLAIPEELKDRWESAKEDAIVDRLVVMAISLGLVALAVGLIIGIGYLLT